MLLPLRRSLLVLALALPWSFGSAVGAEQSTLARRQVPAVDASSTEARVIVKYRNNASVLTSGQTKTVLSATGPTTGPQVADRVSARMGLALTDGRSISPRSQVLHGKGMSSRVLAEKLAADADVEWAVPDERRFITAAPNDPLYRDSQTTATPVAGQWYLRAPTSAVKAAIDVETAWAVTQGSTSIVVAVLDTGVVRSHPDLTSKLLAGYDFINTAATANDGNGRDADPSDPGDWVTTAEAATATFKDCDVSNSSWHGTRTSSLIGAATNNGVGMAGVAPNVMILPVRVLGKCGGYDSDIQAGMRWAAGLSGTGMAPPAVPARVINMSLGSSGTCKTSYQSVIDELTAAKVTVVAAAGNEGLAVGVPANCTGVVAVGGVRHAGTKVGYSDLGPEVTVSAPAGNCVNSTGQCLYSIITAGDTGTTVPTASNYSDGNNYSVGTSFSAPLVSGTVALMLSANPALTPGEIISLLKSSATAFPVSTDTTISACQAPSATAQNTECNCTTTTCGAGLLNAGKAVVAAQGTEPPTPVIASSAGLVLVGESVTLNGAGSTAPGSRTIVNYLWEITTGSTFASFSTGATLSSATLLAKAEGSVTVRLTVTDSIGKTATTSSSFAVATGKPSASFTLPSSTATAGDTVALNGSGTAQGSARISAYLWEITSGTGFASISGSSTAATTTLLASAAGTVTIRLTVTDSNGYTGSTSQTLTVNAATVMTPTSTSSTGSSGGGGAASGAWLLLLAAAGGLLQRGRRRDQATESCG